MALQLRRGTDAQRQSLQLQDGELVWTTDTHKLYVGDGTSLGGLNVLKNVAGNGVAWNETTQKLDFVQENLSLTTVNVPEGNGGGLYFTPNRASAAVAAALNAGGPTGISFSYDTNTGHITATVTGANLLPPVSGNNGKWLTIDDSGNLLWHTAPFGSGLTLPSQPGNQGSYLTTDGTNLIWSQIAINTLSGGIGGTHRASLNVVTGEFTTTGDIVSGGNIKIDQNKDILRFNGTSYVSVLGGLQQVAGDSAPGLGGDLTLNSHNIIGTGNINITGTLTVTGLGANLGLNSHNITGTGNVNINGSVTANSLVSNVISGNGASVVVSSSAQTPLSIHAIGAGSLDSGYVPALALNSSKGTIGTPLDTVPGDTLYAINFTGYHSGSYLSAGGLNYAWDANAILTDMAPASVLTVFTQAGDGNGVNGSGYNLLTFDSTGTLAMPTVKVESGSAAHPSIVFDESANDTGFFHPGDGIICVSINATERVRIDSGGIRTTGFMKVGSFNGSGNYPSPPEAGMMILDSNDGHFYGYNGSNWQRLDN